VTGDRQQRYNFFNWDRERHGGQHQCELQFTVSASRTLVASFQAYTHYQAAMNLLMVLLPG